MQLVKIIKKTSNKIEQAKVIIAIFCLLSEIKLSDNELTVLAYFMVYGIKAETDELIIKSQIHTPFSLNNTKSKLKRFGLIKKNTQSRQYQINDKLGVKPEANIGMLIKIDNS